jgi:hypothetical protein
VTWERARHRLRRGCDIPRDVQRLLRPRTFEGKLADRGLAIAEMEARPKARDFDARVDRLAQISSA